MAPKLPVPDRPRFDLWADVELDFQSRAFARLEKRGDQALRKLVKTWSHLAAPAVLRDPRNRM